MPSRHVLRWPHRRGLPRVHRVSCPPQKTNTHAPIQPHSRKEGAYGLIVNALAEDTTLPQAVEGGLAPNFYQAFAHNRLRRGGPVRACVRVSLVSCCRCSSIPPFSVYSTSMCLMSWMDEIYG